MTASFADQEIWHVMLASDDMKRMNVDQLDDAFRLSLVDASTMVWKAGMNTWQRLGSIAGIEDEVETIARPAAAVQQLLTSRAPAWPMPPSAPPPPRPAPRALASTAVNPFAMTTPVFSTPQLVAPVYSAPRPAADPYVLPKRRVAIASEVDFRRRSVKARLGFWLGGLLLLTAGVLAAYRQNLLREGARPLGLEGKYLAGEARVTGYVTAKAPPVIQQALTRLALLPGPNALSPSRPALFEAKPSPALAVAGAAVQLVEPARTEPEVKTVSLDSLPVLASEPAAAAPHAAPVVAAAAPRAKSEPKPVAARAKAAAPEPAAKPVKKEAALPPASPNDSFLKAAIRQAIIADAAKGK